MSLYKEKKKLEGLYGLCAAQCSETYHHWRVFTGTADGACIEIRRAPLEAALDDILGVHYGAVDYLKLEDVEDLTSNDVDRLPFVKRQGFAAEEEYRIIAESDEAQRPAMSIEFPLNWINRIYLNPWLPKSIAESVIATLKELPDCNKISVTKSLLIESGRWKRAGDKVIGRKQGKRAKLAKSASKE